MEYTREYSRMTNALRAINRIAQKNDLWAVPGKRLYCNNENGRWAKIEMIVDNMGFCKKVLIKTNFEF